MTTTTTATTTVMIVITTSMSTTTRRRCFAQWSIDADLGFSFRIGAQNQPLGVGLDFQIVLENLCMYVCLCSSIPSWGYCTNTERFVRFVIAIATLDLAQKTARYRRQAHPIPQCDFRVRCKIVSDLWFQATMRVIPESGVLANFLQQTGEKKTKPWQIYSQIFVIFPGRMATKHFTKYPFLFPQCTK